MGAMERAENKVAPRRVSGSRSRRTGRGVRLLENIGRLIEQSTDIRATLDRIVTLVSERLDMEVCSVYSYSPSTNRLLLLASTGLPSESVGRVGMDVGEGLTGFAIQKREPVMAIDALAHPRYKYFPETGEERYHSFLGVPIFDRRKPLGVLVAQTTRRRRFTRDEIRLVKAAAVAIGGLLAQLRLLRSLENKEEERLGYHRRMVDALKRLQTYERRTQGSRRTADTVRLTGLAAAPGFAIGRAHIITPDVSFADRPHRRAGSPKRERERFAEAVAKSAREIDRLQERAKASFPEIDVSLFDTHRLMLTDPAFAEAIEKAIKAGSSAEEALERTVQAVVEQFAGLDEAYMRERSLDVKEIGQRILRNLLGVAERDRSFASKVVLVAEDLSLADVILMERQQLQGIVTAEGGVTSHASILARSMEIPTVVGVRDLTATLTSGDHLVVDGNAGTVYVNPDVAVLREYERLKREYRAFNRELDSLREQPAVTKDGCRIHLAANIGLLSDLHLALRHGAEGIGLYRTEIAFMSHRDFLTEEEQVRLYSRIVRDAAGLPVTFRTLDLGADKYPSYLHAPPEANPFLGWRSIRISLEMTDVFKAQLRAILRTSTLGPVRIMFPMISSVEEVLRVKELLAEAGDDLQLAGLGFDPQIPMGIMVEVPAAVQLADRLIQEVDFFSIGTNDLIQYLLAVDRNNLKVAPLYEPLHPATLRAVAATINAAKAAGKRVSLCGEMAADPLCTLVLIGMGMRELSMSPFFVPITKRLIRSVDIAGAERLAGEVLDLATSKEVRGHVVEHMRHLDLVDLMETYH